MAYTADWPRRATSQASATASSSVGLPLTGTRMRLVRITASRGDCSASHHSWVKRSDTEAPGGAQKPQGANAVFNATVHRRVDRVGEGYAARDHIEFRS